MEIKLSFAQGCAWRATYLTNVGLKDKQCAYGADHQFFHIGIDPTHDARGPSCFGAISNPFDRRGWSFRWRFGLPYQPWHSWSVQKRTWLGMALYRVNSKFYFSLDGRFLNNRANGAVTIQPTGAK